MAMNGSQAGFYQVRLTSGSGLFQEQVACSQALGLSMTPDIQRCETLIEQHIGGVFIVCGGDHVNAKELLLLFTTRKH